MKTRKSVTFVGISSFLFLCTATLGQTVLYKGDQKAETGNPDQGGGLFNARDIAVTELVNSAEAVITQIQSVEKQQKTLEDQLNQLLNSISNKPGDYALHRQFADSMIQYIDLMLGTINDIRKHDLLKKRDRVVKLLSELANTLEDHAKLTSQQLGNAIEDTKPLLSTLYTTEGKLARAYRANAEEYNKRDIEGSLKKLDKYLSALNYARETVVLIGHALKGFEEDAAALEVLREMKINLSKVTMFFYQFGEEVQKTIDRVEKDGKDAS